MPRLLRRKAAAIYLGISLAMLDLLRLQGEVEPVPMPGRNGQPIRTPLYDRIDLDDAKLKAPSSTWTYLINDNTFEDMLGVQLIGNAGLQVGAGIWWPLMLFYSLVRKLSRKK
ncbi:hypothetical protein IH879_17695 [candidate division KSB1 bacterium]|nr:hypothetical protein [candidate division KSB1 bacterium]